MPPRKPNQNRSSHHNGSARMVLARLREKSGKSLSDLAADTTHDRIYLHKLETGVKLGSPDVMEALDKAYGTDEHLVHLCVLARADGIKDKYRHFMEREREATMRYEYASSTIPGLLQTESYAREQLRTARPADDNELDAQVITRLDRQAPLHGEDAVEFRAVLDESAVRRPLSDADAWSEQLAHLLETAELPNVTLQVLPFSAGLQHLLGGSLTLLWLPGGRNIAYTESAYSGDLVEDPTDVEQLRLSYDLVRDSALSPRESVALIREILEASPSCEPPDSTSAKPHGGSPATATRTGATA
ncbi:helix-turn-helix domain-containing protein [Streptomyces apricus]|uniref:Helix-turn-helix domain-containing protein n=1 Tax=Streptomyces apricus TaxID=1828112 RepID=A0A5A9ZL89_9ACTN|nr:helix-turn-helix domain-containing protein [Streptomyces apricus]